MIKLLNAGFFRLRKNKIFWGIVIITLGIAFFSFQNSANSANKIDILLIKYLLVIGLFIAIFTSLFVGLEYANGTIKNKIIVGHSRIKIYIANLIISISVGLILELFYIILISIVGIPVLGGLYMSLYEFAFILLDTIMIIITYSSIFTFISLICTDITLSTVISIVLIIVFYISSSTLGLTANTEKYLYHTSYNEQGMSKEIIGINPNYPGDINKNVCQTLLKIIPTGQCNELYSYVSNLVYKLDNNIDIKVLSLYSLGVIIIINSIGIYCFNKKDFK